MKFNTNAIFIKEHTRIKNTNGIIILGMKSKDHNAS